MSRSNAVLRVLLGAVVAACQTAPTDSGEPATGAPSTPGPAASAGVGATSQPSPPVDMVIGPGEMYLLDGADGLETLASYTATLTVTFEGTRDGTASGWTSTTTYAFVREPAAYLLVVEQPADLPAVQPAWSARADGAVYSRLADDQCQASLPEPAANPGDDPEADPAGPLPLDPAARLPGFIGADVTGTETVNGIAAEVATLTPAALGWSGGNAVGSVAIAVDGDYVLRYDLTTQGGPELFGAGISGRLIRHYELSAIGSTTVTIPAGCPAGLLQAHGPEDGLVVESLPGLLTMTTKSSVIDTAKLYRDTSIAFGWTTAREATINEDLGSLGFTAAGLAITVSVTPTTGGSQIQIAATRT